MYHLIFPQKGPATGVVSHRDIDKYHDAASYLQNKLSDLFITTRILEMVNGNRNSMAETSRKPHWLHT